LMLDSCNVCAKVLDDSEGFRSSTGVVVCSDSCKDKFLLSLPNRGESELTVYSRVTGYYTPVSAWNKGKKQEFKDRLHYNLKGVLG
jgi:anaerobic ribonucleoside-triphosphate reductase